MSRQRRGQAQNPADLNVGRRTGHPPIAPEGSRLGGGAVAVDPAGRPYTIPFNTTASGGAPPATIGDGDVHGPSAAPDNALARFDGTDGKTLQSGAAFEEDDGRLTNVTDPTNAGDVATKHYVDLFAPGAALTRGIIAHWAPALGAIPPGWALCDGTLGTPNLVDLFVV